MRYPYTRLTSRLPPRPYLNIHFRYRFAVTETLFGLVDSGADYSILPWEFARTLKINVANGTVWSFTGTTGKAQIGYLHTVEIGVWTPDGNGLEFRFNTPVAFCEDFKFPGGMLLGQIGFLSQFIATFNQAENYFDLEPRDPTIRVQQDLFPNASAALSPA